MSEKYARCVLIGVRDERLSFCGKNIPRSEWCFVDSTHAILNARREGILTICKECGEIMIKEIKNGIDKDKIT